MEKSSENTIIASVLVFLFSPNIFNLISSFLLRYLSVLRCLFLFSKDSKVKFEPTYARSKEEGNKHGARLDEETQDGCSLLGKDINMVMERMGISRLGLLEGKEEVEKRWGCGEISRVLEEEEEEEGVREKEMKKAFDVFDQDKDGFIDARELQRVIIALGFRQQEAEFKACREMIRVFDHNEDGKIDFHEFVRLFCEE